MCNFAAVQIHFSCIYSFCCVPFIMQLKLIQTWWVQCSWKCMKYGWIFICWLRYILLILFVGFFFSLVFKNGAIAYCSHSTSSGCANSCFILYFFACIVLLLFCCWWCFSVLFFYLFRFPYYSFVLIRSPPQLDNLAKVGIASYRTTMLCTFRCNDCVNGGGRGEVGDRVFRIVSREIIEKVGWRVFHF